MQQSLVKYATPILINNLPKDKDGKGNPDSPDNILHSILSSREWTEGEKRWVQHVSSTPGTRLDVVNLQEQLDRRLLEEHARETGICEIREELYGQAFDELIRQASVACAERGLLLLRVRKELKSNLDCYRTLYESSIGFGLRKALNAESRRQQNKTSSEQLQREIEDLKTQIVFCKKERVDNQTAFSKQTQLDQQKHDEEVAALNKANDLIKEQLEALLSVPKKVST